MSRVERKRLEKEAKKIRKLDFLNPKIRKHKR